MTAQPSFEKLLESQKVWIRKHVSGYTNDATLIVDLRQECGIAMWQAYTNWDGSGVLLGWMRQNARWRMMNLAKHRKTQPEGPVDQDFDWETIVSGSADLNDIAAAYHEGEIAAAVAALPPKQREYVLRRFWGGQQQPEISAQMGTVNANSTYWGSRYGARIRLKESLSHLEIVRG